MFSLTPIGYLHGFTDGSAAKSRFTSIPFAGIHHMTRIYDYIEFE